MVWTQGCKAEKAGVLAGFVAACSKGGGTRKEICEKDHTGSHRGEAQRSLREIWAEIRSDLLWWHRFLDKWNGVGILPTPNMEVIHLGSDASGSWGCAAIWNNRWLQWQWNNRAQEWQIARKELLPIVLATLVWGRVGRQKSVLPL